MIDLSPLSPPYVSPPPAAGLVGPAPSAPRCPVAARRCRSSVTVGVAGPRTRPPTQPPARPPTPGPGPGGSLGVVTLRVEDVEVARSQPLLQLSLKKPRNWNWTLSTSASCPAILLKDHKGRLLLDTRQRDSSGTDSSRTHSSRNESSSIHASRNHSSRTESSRAHASRTESSRTDSSRSESSRSHASRTDSSRNESSRTKSSRTSTSPPHRKRRRKGNPASCVCRRERPDDAVVAANLAADVAVATPAAAPEDHLAAMPTAVLAASGSLALPALGSPMGSNVSRHNGKGLSGRRAASSGSLCAADRLGRLLAPCHHRRRSERDGGCASAGSGSGVGPNGHDRHHRDRYKLCGSLPSHLDSDIADNNNILPSPAVSEKDVQLQLQMRLHSMQSLCVATDLGDQGYASERSPDEDAGMSDTPASPSPPGSPSPNWLRLERAQHVALRRGPRGLGLSVCGGADAATDGLVRIKRLFPHQPAWQSGRLAPGDVLLAVNGISLAGLSNHAALEVLRTATPAEKVVLTVVRPPPPTGREGGLADHGPSPPPSPSPMPPPPPRRQDSVGELEVVLAKVHGSLGFTLRKEDSSVLGHYVRALVREPALSDGRVRPGDKIVAVNGVDMSNLSHEEAVAYLRRCGDVVTLRLWRDAAPTPLSALSPTESRAPSLGALSLGALSSPAPVRPKPLLRKEAMDMLSVLAERKRQSPASPLTSASSDARSTDARSPIVSLADSTTRSSSPMSASSASAASVLTEVEMPVSRPPRRPDSLNLDNQPLHRARWKLQRLSVSPGDAAVDGQGEIEWDSSETPSPPGSPRTATATATAVNCHENHIGSRAKSNSIGDPDQLNSEFSSLPPLQNDAGFSHRNPAYQSAHATCRVAPRMPTSAPSQGHSAANTNDTIGPNPANSRTKISEQDLGGLGQGGSHGLLKWKGVVFTPDEAASSVDGDFVDGDFVDGDFVDKSSVDFDNESLCQLSPDDTNGQVLTVELTRGWNSRLGFSLKADRDGQHSSISAIYDDSVAAKDGRLKIGDTIIMVNDDSVEGMKTADLIDLFRKIRGSVAITVWRRDSVGEKSTPKSRRPSVPR